MIISAIKTSINIKSPIKNKINISFKSQNNDNKSDSKLIFDNNIQGYYNEKEKFFTDFLAPINSENPRSRTISSVSLSSADKYVLDMFKKAILAFAQINAINFVEIPTNIDSKNLINIINFHLRNNAQCFLENKKRSIILMEKPERFIGLDASEVEAFSPLKLSKKDLKLIDKNNCFGNLNYFKSILDFCNKLPNFSRNGAATTFIFRTQNPQLIHPDMRDGKMEKFHLDFPKASDIDEIIKSHIIKKWGNKIDSEKITKMTPLLAQFFEINNCQAGAYSTETIIKIIDKAFQEAKDFETDSLAMSIIKTIKDTPNDISKNQIKYYKNIKNLISKTLDKYEIYKSLEEDGMLDDNEMASFKKLINSEIIQMKQLIKKRKNKTITQTEKELLQKLVKRYG